MQESSSGASAQSTSANGASTNITADVVVIGSGSDGLVAGALLARAGKRVMVCESHGIPGGAAHSFTRQGFHFDSGPSFYCGLSDPRSLNPLRQVLDALGESVPAIAAGQGLLLSCHTPIPGLYRVGDSTLPGIGVPAVAASGILCANMLI